MKKILKITSFVIFLTLVFLGGNIESLNYNHTAGANSRSEELREKIEEHNAQIKQIEQEIAIYQQDLAQLGQAKQTLEQEMAQLDLSRKKLSADISLLQQRIDTADLKIEKLSLDIQEKERRIEQNRLAIASSLRHIDEQADQSLVEAFLSEKSLSNAWAVKERLEQFQVRLKDDLATMRVLKDEIEIQKDEMTEAKKAMVVDRQSLEDKRLLIDYARDEQQSLIAQTENQEEGYQSIIEEKQRQKLAFQQDLFDFESQLNIALDPSRIPGAGAHVLSWPLGNIRVTQQFGKTVSAQRLYTSGTHNGVDFGASRGTNVLAARGGVVRGVGDTDLQRGCYSYGKWVLIEHDNGISTLYAHLDLIKVSTGQQVARGETIGYSGNTGYSTGPHLHFTVYATQGVRVQQYTQSINCKQVSIPIADSKAYLDPMQYLPQI